QRGAELRRRPQQVIAAETGVAAVADPLGGSYYVEALTDQVEEEALRIMAEVDERGGAVAAIESGWMQRRIAESAYRQQRRIESGSRVVVGVNRFQADGGDAVEIVRIGPKHQQAQVEALRELRARRDGA